MVRPSTLRMRRKRTKRSAKLRSTARTRETTKKPVRAAEGLSMWYTCWVLFHLLNNITDYDTYWNRLYVGQCNPCTVWTAVEFISHPFQSSVVFLNTVDMANLLFCTSRNVVQLGETEFTVANAYIWSMEVMCWSAADYIVQTEVKAYHCQKACKIRYCCFFVNMSMGKLDFISVAFPSNQQIHGCNIKYIYIFLNARLYLCLHVSG